MHATKITYVVLIYICCLCPFVPQLKVQEDALVIFLALHSTYKTVTTFGLFLASWPRLDSESIPIVRSIQQFYFTPLGIDDNST